MKRFYYLVAVALLLFGVTSSASVFSIPSGTAEAGVIISPVSTIGDACTGCTSASDSLIHQEIFDSSDVLAAYSASWKSAQFTVSIDECVTGYYYHAQDEGNVGTLYFEIQGDSAGEPDGNAVAGSTFTGDGDDIASTLAENELLLGTPFVLTTGTYHLVRYGTLSTSDQIDNTSAPGTYLYSSDSGSTWTPSTNHRRMGVMGCN